METKFNHSIKVPNQLRKAARFVKKAFEEGASVKGQIFEEKHAVIYKILSILYLLQTQNLVKSLNFVENTTIVCINCKSFQT